MTPVNIVLHVGPGKTGTSSIQASCDRNRERLRRAGVLYPLTPGAARHGRFGLLFRSDEELAVSPHWGRQPWDDPAEFRRDFRRDLLAEIEDAGLPTVLFSDEGLFAATSDPALGRLRGLLDDQARSVRVVAYLRRQDDHLVSRYQQMVKTGEVRRLGDWAADDFSRIYDYDEALRRHEALLRPDTLVVRRFERSRFADRSLLQDFLDAAGVEVRADGLEVVPDRNESLDAESVEFLRLFNVLKAARGAQVGLMDNRRVVRRLVRARSGPTLTLPDPDLDRVMERWRSSNQAVASRWFGEDGDLFADPRKSSGTTTHQFLDPGRVDHFLEVAELPGRWHEPLRRTAEREATAEP